MLFREYATQWETNVAAVTAQETRKTRKSHLQTHILPALGGLRVEELTQRTIQGFVSQLSANLAPKSVKNVWGTLQCILTDAERDDLIKEVPKPRMRRLQAPEQPKFTLHTARAIIGASADPELKALWWFLAETGARIDETLRVTWANLSNDGILKLEGTKTNAARRTLAVSSHLQVLLSAATQPRQGGLSGLIFAKCETYYRNALADLVRGMDIGGVAPFHAFRRFSRSLAGELGMPWDLAEYRLGHSLPGVAGKYRFFRPGEDREWAEKIAEALL